MEEQNNYLECLATQNGLSVEQVKAAIQEAYQKPQLFNAILDKGITPSFENIVKEYALKLNQS